MITKLQLLNFQSHEKASITFDPGVNVIVGRSDSGKSALLRAIRWCLRNRPSGSSFRSSWGGDTGVLIHTTEGVAFRHKGKEDKYELNLLNRPGVTYRAFGTNVPEDITRFLNINNTNFQFQLDAPYLLSDSAGEVAAHFNKIANLDVIDIATSNINSWIRELNSDIKSTESIIKACQEQLKNFAYLEKLEIELEVLEDIEKQLSRKVARSGKLADIINDIDELEDEALSYNTLLTIDPLLNKVEKLMRELEVKEKKVERLDEIGGELSGVESNLAFYSGLLYGEDLVNKVIELSTALSEQDEYRDDLADMINRIDNVELRIKKQKESLLQLVKKFDDNFPDTCPLCGKPKEDLQV